MKKKIAVLSLSGGMDSTCLLTHLLRNEYYDKVYCISFNYGQKHNVELERAQANVQYIRNEEHRKWFKEGKSEDYESKIISHKIVDLSSIMGMFNSALTSENVKVPEGHYSEENMKATVVPNRNAIFSSIIYGLALSLSKEFDTAVDISLGIHSGDHDIYPDCRPEFRDALEHAFKIGNWDSERVSYYTPYLTGNKTTILQDALENCKVLGIDFDKVLANTITSYNPDAKGRSSGKSGSDIERVEAFINIGRKDPIAYQQSWEEVVEHAKTILNEKNSNL